MSSETFQINDVVLDVLPSDIMQFNNNAVYEESFIRSKATFAFRSKYSNSKIIITQPVSMNPLAFKNTTEASSQKDGLKVLHQLSQYPFCFIKSTRIKSYLASRANFSSTGFMMFLVDEINIVHDMSLPDVMFVEYHLVYNDHTSQIPDFKFVSSDGNYEVDNPMDSLVFTESFEMGFEEKYNSFIKNVLDYKSKVDGNQANKVYSETTTPYNIIEALTPQVLEQTEFNSGTFSQELEEIKKSFDYKVVKVTAKDGNNNVTPDFLSGYTGQNSTGDSLTDQEEDDLQINDTLQTLYVYWTSFHTLSFNGPSSIQSLKISFKNKLAKLSVGTHKYPIVQHLGRFPARLDLVLNFSNGFIYETDDSSIISAIGQISNILDYNNDMYPEIGAYNTIKIRSVITQLLGIEDFVPNQTNVRASSDSNGQEIVTLSFIESEVSDFVKAGKVTKGRPSAYDNFSSNELDAVLAFITNIGNNSGFRTMLEESKYVEMYGQVVNYIAQATVMGRKSFYGGIEKEDLLSLINTNKTEVSKAIYGDLTKDVDLQNITTNSSISSFSSYNYPSPESTRTSSASTAQQALGIVQNTVVIKTYYNSDYIQTMKLFLQRWKEGLDFIQKSDGDGNKVYDNSDSLFKNNGTVNSLILDAFQLLVTLKEKGEVPASSVINTQKALASGTPEYLKDKLRNYSGTCLPDLPFSSLLDPDVDPFFFLSYRSYLTREQFKVLHETFQKEVFEGFDKSITTSLQTVETDSGWLKSGSWSLFSEKGTSVKERFIVAEAEGKGVVATGDFSDSTYKLLSPTEKKIASKVSTTQYDSLINKHAQTYNIPAGLLKALIHQESHFNPNARSSVGAQGLTQLMPSTAQSLGVTNAFDPDQAIMGGAKYLGSLIKRFKTYELGLAAYNGGMGNVIKYKGIPPFKETQNYVKNVLGFYYNLYSRGLESAPTNKSVSDNKSSTTSLTVKAQEAINNKTSNGIKEQLKNGTVYKAKVLKIVDGDTFQVEYQGKTYEIRPMYYDAPETSHRVSFKGSDGTFIYTKRSNNGGDDATRYLESIMPINSTVILESDPTSSKNQDDHQRVTSSVLLDGTYQNIADAMISTGNAFAWVKQTSGGSTVLNDLINKQNEAKRQNLGVHGKTSLKQVADLKSNLNKLQQELTLAKSDEDRIKILRKYSDYLEGDTFIYDGKVYALSPKTGANTDNDKTNKLKKAVASIYANKTEISKVNYNIHVKGVNCSSYSEAQAYITGEWGSRPITQNGRTVGYRMHYGIDIGSSKVPSQDVVAAADGIASTRYLTGGGKTVVIDHGNGFYTRYMHLKEFRVKNQAKVTTGQVIGVIGNTNTNSGTSDGGQYHLHQETWVDVSGGGSNKLVNVHPFKTTSLKNLSGLDPKYVRANITKYISDPDVSRTTNLTSKDGVSVYGLNNSGTSIYTGKEISSGKEVQNTYANGNSGSTDVSSTNEALDANVPKRYKAVDRGISDPYSVFYEQNNAQAQYTVATYHTGLGMKVCLPTLKVYMVVGSEVEDEKIGANIKNSYYFELDGISDVKIVCNNDQNPVDYLTFKVANPSFINTDLIALAGKYLTRDFSSVNTSAEVSFTSDRLRIQPGTKIHFRAGYGNNPNDLVTMFNGTIVESSSPQGVSLTVLAEGYGRELLLDSLSKSSPNQLSSADTPSVIAHAFGDGESITNFGATSSLAKAFIGTIAVGSKGLTGHDYTDPENKRLTTNMLGLSLYEPGNWKQRAFANIYAAEVESVHDSYNTSWVNYLKKLVNFNTNEMFGYKYIMMGQSPWEVIKEMEYRHPGTLVKPLFYQDRMTMFFGYKDQMYIAKDLEPHFMSKVATYDNDVTMSAEYIKNRPLRFEPVTKFHLVTSEFNLLSNNIKLSNLFKTGVKVAYFDRGSVKQTNNTDSMHEFDMKVDDTLMPFENRIGTLDMPGIHGKYSAFMYGTTYLRKQLEMMYDGTITIIGNPHVKAGDYIHLKDSQKRIEGLMKVRACTHSFTEQTGFVTEITPGLFVEPRNFMYSALMLKLSYTAKIALANAKLSSSIVSNENTDFDTYQEYLKQLKFYIKRPTNWFDNLGSGEYTSAGDLWYHDGGSAIIYSGIATFSFFGISKLLFGGTSLLSKGALTALDLRKDWSAISSTYEYMKGIKSSQTSLNLFAKSKAFWRLANIKNSASATEKATKAATLALRFRSVISAAGGAAWYASSRTIGSLIALMSNSLLTNPIGWLIRIGLGIAFTVLNNKIQESELTRQPLMFFPVSYSGKPFVAGITGYKYDSFYEALKTNFTRNLKALSKGAYAVEMASNKSLARSVAVFVQNSGLSQYRNDQIDKVRKGFNSLSEDAKLRDKTTSIQSNPF